MYNKWTGTFVTPSPPSVSPGAVVNGTGLQHRLCVFESAIGTVLWLLALVSTNGQRATSSADAYRCVKAKAKLLAFDVPGHGDARTLIPSTYFPSGTAPMPGSVAVYRSTSARRTRTSYVTARRGRPPHSALTAVGTELDVAVQFGHPIVAARCK